MYSRSCLGAIPLAAGKLCSRKPHAFPHLIDWIAMFANSPYVFLQFSMLAGGVLNFVLVFVPLWWILRNQHASRQTSSLCEWPMHFMVNLMVNYPDSCSFKFQSLIWGQITMLLYALFLLARPRYPAKLHVPFCSSNFPIKMVIVMQQPLGWPNTLAPARFQTWGGTGWSMIRAVTGWLSYKRPPEKLPEKLPKLEIPHVMINQNGCYVEQPMRIQPTTRSTRVRNQFRLRMVLHKKGPAPGAG